MVLGSLMTLPSLNWLLISAFSIRLIFAPTAASCTASIVPAGTALAPTTTENASKVPSGAMSVSFSIAPSVNSKSHAVALFASSTCSLSILPVGNSRFTFFMTVRGSFAIAFCKSSAP